MATEEEMARESVARLWVRLFFLAALGVLPAAANIPGFAETTLARAGDFTDSRAYFYGNLNRRLTEERLNLDATKRWTNIYSFDNGTGSGPGVLTKIGRNSLAPTART